MTFGPNAMVHHDTDLFDLTVRTSHGTAVIHTTEHHPFWDETTHISTDADRLRAGHRLHTDDGTLASVVAVVVLPGSAPMWDLTVNHTHTFYIRTASTYVLVHNADPGMKCDLLLGAGPNAREGCL
ncbi:polymorphic toxin-type HINT domain-containing protein [Pseudofrankia inefficax]|uniref:polymorphic toxin-type HINT domain-containing protein n=1 Tax=Pseudofrankia inefficax (strain DSM 45817 / CECT 9037 / DDB 130130 / EuI1c) TaxID=298654 RepID=UPI0001BFB6FF|nr:polymorphic toxin-type HINT domain-containing protein [Pseudofrankia inefficax]